jgi:hypothetical protein
VPRGSGYKGPPEALTQYLAVVTASKFSASYDTGPVVQYASVMRGYLSVPGALLADTSQLVLWFDRVFAWIATLPRKPTKP